MTRRNRRASRNRMQQSPAAQKSQPKVDSTGKAATGRPNRSTLKAGPSVAVPMSNSALKVAGASAAKAVKVKSGTTANAHVHVNGTDFSKTTVKLNIKSMTAFVQGVAMAVAKLYPAAFVNPATADTPSEWITPVDLIAYNFVCIMAGFNKASQLASSFSQALNSFPEDSYVLLPVAEYIRRMIEVVGAPNIQRLFSYDTDQTISNGQLLAGGSAYVANELSSNAWGTETGLSWVQLWQYAVPLGPNPAANNDYAAYSVPFTLNLLAPSPGRESWMQTRFPAVMAYMAGLPLGKVRFNQIPLSTVDYSGFSGADGGQTWEDAERLLSPSPRHNVDIAIWLDPNSTGQNYPLLSFQSGVLKSTIAVQGGDYGNTFAGSGSFYGQPVVPLNMTRVAQVSGTFNHITLSADYLPKSFFGKEGYKYAGYDIPQVARMVAMPIDVAGLVGKMIQVLLAQLNTNSTVPLNLTPGIINGWYALAQGCLVRKILTAGQFESLITLSPNTPTSNWSVQALYPSTAYITSELPVGWVNILDQIGPVYYNKILFYPVFGTTLPQLWSTGSGAAKYNYWAKFGFNSGGNLPAQNTYPPLATVWPTPTAAQVSQLSHPFVLMFNPSGAANNSSYWYNSSTYNTYNIVTVFTDSLAVPGEAVLGGAGGTVLSLSSSATYIYNAASQAAYNTASPTYEVNMVYQYSAVESAFQFLCNVGKLNVKDAKGYSLVPTQKLVGSTSMVAVVLGSLTAGPQRSVANARFLLQDPTNANVSANLGVTCSTTENDVVQSNCFLTNARIWLVASSEIVKQYVCAATRPNLGSYTKMGYTIRLADKDGFSLWQQYAADLAADGSAVNTMIKKHMASGRTMGHVENALTASRITESEATAVVLSAFLDQAVNSQFTYGSKCESLEEIKKQVLISKAKGVPTQPIAAQYALQEIYTLRSCDDSTSSKFLSFAKGAFKGLKTVAPYVKDLIGAAALFV